MTEAATQNMKLTAQISRLTINGWQLPPTNT
jgi:hypothetical protein